ncbi:unnamed protein product [Lepidochelys kempii]
MSLLQTNRRTRSQSVATVKTWSSTRDKSMTCIWLLKDKRNQKYMFYDQLHELLFKPPFLHRQKIYEKKVYCAAAGRGNVLHIFFYQKISAFKVMKGQPLPQDPASGDGSRLPLVSLRSQLLKNLRDLS